MKSMNPNDSQDDLAIPEQDSVVDSDQSGSRGTGSHEKSWLRTSLNPFRIATLRGLGVVLPPLLTIILFFWAWNTIERAVLRPVEAAARYVIVWSTQEIVDDDTMAREINALPDAQARRKTIDDRQVVTRKDGRSFTWKRMAGALTPGTSMRGVSTPSLNWPTPSSESNTSPIMRLN